MCKCRMYSGTSDKGHSEKMSIIRRYSINTWVEVEEGEPDNLPNYYTTGLWIAYIEYYTLFSSVLTE